MPAGGRLRRVQRRRHVLRYPDHDRGPRAVRRKGRPKNPVPAYPDQHGFTMVELPYKGDELSLVVLLPQAADGLPALEKMLTPANLQAWIGKLQRRKVNVFLPKFKLETSYEMKEALIALGMVRALAGGDGAQFNGMCEAGSPNSLLAMSCTRPLSR